MISGKKYRIINCICVCGFLLLAWILGYLYDGPLLSLRKLLGPLQTFVYAAVIGIWAYSVHWRIIQPYIRKCLLRICLVMALWLGLRSVKFFFAQDPDLVRFLWYSYYIGILFIPLLAFFASLSIGKSDDFIFPKGFGVMTGVTAALVGMALTNDLHQFVFVFPSNEAVWSDLDYSYNWGYALIVGWCALCIVGALILMLKKSRRQNRLFYRWLPFLPLVFLVVYLTAYSLYNVRIPFDLTIMYNLTYLLVFECCIQCGLVHSNTGYDFLFENGSNGAQIVDSDGNVLQSSRSAYELLPEQRKQALSQILRPEEHVRIRCNPIRNGYVLWKEDVSELDTLLERLQDNNESIEASVAIQQEAYETQRKISSLQEKNRLYDLLQTQTAGQIDLMDQLLEAYEGTTTGEKRQELLARLTVVGTYIKRRGNLLFIAEKGNAIDSGELSLCLEESFVSLRLCGVDCGLDMEKGHMLTAECAFRVYDLFEEVVEYTFDDCQSIYMKARFSNQPVLALWVESGRDLYALSDRWHSMETEDGMQHLTFWLDRAEAGKGGTCQ